MDQIASTAMTYDIFNNMTAYGSDSYSYDDANQRLKKTESGTTTYYIRNGLSTLAEYDGSGDLLGEYIHDDRGLIAKFDSTEGYFWYITDHLGSTRRLESTSMQRDYYPFGEDYLAAGSETDYQFTGKELDSGSGLYYFGARYYDPVIGRWLSVDPLAGKFPSLSPYNYVTNNPLNAVDGDG